MNNIKKTKNNLLIGKFAILVILIFQFGFTQDTLSKIKKEGFIRVGFANESPYSYADSAGKLQGESPTVFKYVMNELGVKEVDGVLTEWGSLIPGLKSGRFDAIVASMYITPKRCKEIIFSNPTYGIGDAVVVRKGRKKFRSLTDAVNAGAKLVFVSGTAQVEHANMLGIGKSKLMLVPDFNAQIAAIRSGRVDGGIMTDFTARDAVAKVKGLVNITYTFKHKGKVYKGQGGFGFRREDTSLRDTVNEVLSKYIGSSKHLKAIGEFGFKKSNLPESTAEELCRG